MGSDRRSTVKLAPAASLTVTTSVMTAFSASALSYEVEAITISSPARQSTTVSRRISAAPTSTVALSRVQAGEGTRPCMSTVPSARRSFDP
eukprot:scaffold54828_cov30-Tisochrysis_lutea.AAC.6